MEYSLASIHDEELIGGPHTQPIYDGSDHGGGGGGGGVKFLCFYCKITAVILYSCLSVLAFVGNSLILAVFIYFRRLRTPTNMLIANLAVADLMISIFCMPLSYWHVVIFEDQRWMFGAFLCKFFNYLQATAVFLSSWTLVAISFDRFMAIMFVMSPWLRISKKKALYAILITWLFSLFMALPLLIVNQVESAPADSRVEVCLEKWSAIDFLGDEEVVVHSYTSLVFALQYCLPLLVLLLTYTFIGLKMWNSKVPGEQTALAKTAPRQGHRLSSFSSVHVKGGEIGGTALLTQQKQQSISHPNHRSFMNRQLDRRHDSVKKLIPMVLLVSALYACCWLPQNLLMNILVTYDPSITSHPYILYIWWGSHTIAMFHSIVNPFIYYSQNKRIHEAVNLLLAHFLPWLPALAKQGHLGTGQQRPSHPFNSFNNTNNLPTTPSTRGNDGTATSTPKAGIPAHVRNRCSESIISFGNSSNSLTAGQRSPRTLRPIRITSAVACMPAIPDGYGSDVPHSDGASLASAASATTGIETSHRSVVLRKSYTEMALK